MIPPISALAFVLAMFTSCGNDERETFEEGGSHRTPPQPDAPSTNERTAVTSETSPPLVASYVGRVVDAFGAPIAGATVTGESVTWLQAVAGNSRDGVMRTRSTRRTGTDGSFALALAVGTPDVAITVSHVDFPPLVATWSAGPATSGTRQLGDVRLRSGIGLSVYATDADSGEAIGNARISIEPALIAPGTPSAFLEALTRSATADRRGIVTFSAMVPGAFTLRAEAEVHALTETIVEHGERPVTHRLALPRGHVLRGRVLAADGRPVADAVIRAAIVGVDSASRPGAVTARTSTSGDFRIPRLPAGTYRVSVASAEHGHAALDAVQVPAEASAAVRLPSRSRIHGILRTAPTAGDPTAQIAGKLVQIRRRDDLANAPGSPAGWEVRTGPGGEFAIDDMPAGRFRLSVSSEDSTPMFAHQDFSAPREHPLVVAAFAARSRVRGRLVDATGQPVAGAAIGMIAADAASARWIDFAAQIAVRGADEGASFGQAEFAGPRLARTDTDGRFEVRVDVSTVETGAGPVANSGGSVSTDTSGSTSTAVSEIALAAGDFRLWVAPLDSASFCTAPLRFDAVDLGGPATDIGTVRVPAADSIRGRVVLAAGAPAIGAMVALERLSVASDGADDPTLPETALPETAIERLTCRTDVTGRFGFSAAILPAGNYRLSVVADTVFPPIAVAATPSPGVDLSVELRIELPGDIGRSLTIQLP